MKPLTDRTDWPPLAVFDIESTAWVDVFLICHVDEFGNRVSFPSISDYLNWIIASQVEYVWAHWGGKYDNRFVLAELHKRGTSFEIVMSGSHAIIVKAFFHAGRVVNFCESARLMPDSVAKIGKTIGLEKLDVDRSHLEKYTLTEAIEYCYRDCDIVLRGLQEMKRALTEVGADFAFTLASIASRWVRRSGVLDFDRFYEGSGPKAKYSKLMTKSDEWCLPAYFGGRTEVFKQGVFKGPLYYYDVRSSYPWSMLGDLPAYPLGWSAPARTITQSLERCGISEAIVTVPKGTYLPVLPVRGDGKLLFPTGTFRGRWANIELLEAYRAGAKIKILGQCLFEPKPFMAGFVNTFFGLRQEAISEGDAFKSYAYKIMLNSAYGKFCETVERVKIVSGEDRIRDAISSGQNPEQTTTPGIYRITTSEVGAFYHTAAGSYITARSRCLLYDRMKKVRDLGGQIYYCDTDSIITDIELPPEPDALGNLKLEMVLTEFEVWAPKVYRAVDTDGKTYYKVKGTPVEKGEDGLKLSEEKSLERWKMYIAGEAVGREGLSGLNTDINRGTMIPRAETLSRALRNKDSKREHVNGESRPLVLIDKMSK